MLYSAVEERPVSVTELVEPPLTVTVDPSAPLEYDTLYPVVSPSGEGGVQLTWREVAPGLVAMGSVGADAAGMRNISL